MSCFSITHLASQLGSNKITYSDFDSKFPEWNMRLVKTKTGIENIFESSTHENVLELSIKSCKKTLTNFDKKKIDCVIVVTQTAEKKLPSVSCVLQDKLNLNKNIIAYDINLGCSGFIYALATLYSLINSDFAKNILLVCSDTYTKYFDRENRTCRSLFSDAASSCIVSKSNSNFSPSFAFFTDGSGSKDLMESKNLITMNGSEVFVFSATSVPKLFKEVLKKSNCTIDRIKHFVFHQASKIILDKLILDLNIPKNKFHINYHEVGNTVSASIPILLEKLVKNNILKKNDLTMLLGFGVGLSAGACIIKW